MGYRLYRRARLSALGRRVAAWRRDRTSPGALARHELRALEPDPSFAGEGRHLQALLRRLGLLELAAGDAADRYAVDLAAGDGVRDSCTLPLFRDHGWRGLAIECDRARFRLLAHVYRRFQRVRLLQERVRPSTAADMLAAAGVPHDFALLNLDLDSFDLPVAAAILERFRPLVVDMEINEKVPPPVRFAVTSVGDGRGRWDEGHCYGCSIAAAADVLTARGYVLEGVEYNNAFFVRGDIAAAGGVAGAELARAWRDGYADRPDRHALFPWNADMEDLLDAPPERALVELRRRFRGFPGTFLLSLERLTTLDTRG